MTPRLRITAAPQASLRLNGSKSGSEPRSLGEASATLGTLQARPEEVGTELPRRPSWPAVDGLQISRITGIIIGLRPVVFCTSRFSSARTFSFTMP